MTTNTNRIVVPMIYTRDEWNLLDNDLEVATLASVTASAEHRILQLADGEVIVVQLAQFVRRGQRPTHHVIFQGQYSDALRFLADVVDNL